MNYIVYITLTECDDAFLINYQETKFKTSDEAVANAFFRTQQKYLLGLSQHGRYYGEIVLHMDLESPENPRTYYWGIKSFSVPLTSRSLLALQQSGYLTT